MLAWKEIRVVPLILQLKKIKFLEREFFQGCMSCSRQTSDKFTAYSMIHSVYESMSVLFVLVYMPMYTGSMCVYMCPLENDTQVLSQTISWLRPLEKIVSLVVAAMELPCSALPSWSLLQGARVIDSFQLPHLWVHRVRNVKPGFHDCSPPMTEHSREYQNKAIPPLTGSPLMGNFGSKTPHGPGRSYVSTIPQPQAPPAQSFTP